MNPPIDIQVNIEQKNVSFIWDDKKTQTLSYQQLRENCQCAWCKAKKFTQKILNHQPNIGITAIYDQGYGVQICFSDGHDKGIFPWEYLRKL